MPVVDINGTSVDFPDTLTPDQLRGAVQAAAHKMTIPDAKNVHDPNFTLGKLWDMAKIPEQKSKEGLKEIADAIPEGSAPTGNLPMDIAKNAPSILAKSGVEALSEVAPGFVSPLSLALMGGGALAKGIQAIPGAAEGIQNAMAPVKNAIGSVAAQGENLASMEPGALKAIFDKPGALFQNSKKLASQLYEAAKAKYPNRLLSLSTPEKVMDSAEVLADAGALNPIEAKTAMKAVSSKLGSGVDDRLYAILKKLEPFKNADPDLAAADQLHALGSKIETAQKILPQNKAGGLSVFKLGEMGALTKWGGPVGAAMAAQFSPAVQALEAVGAGVGAKGLQAVAQNPELGSAAGGILALLQKALLNRRKSK